VQINGQIRVFVLIWAVLFAGPALSAGERLSGFSAGDTVLIEADRAWEAVAPDTIHFSGRFELKAHDWYLSADQATLHGSLNDPETAILRGSPALIQLEIVSDDKIETIEGKGRRIVYQRISNSIRLEGGASLSRAGQTMQSEEIEYDIDLDRIQAGGKQGVQIRVNPEVLPDF
jgi:lipopolysaccharide transport protein LptA